MANVNLDILKKKPLLDLCKELNLKGYSSLNKPQLIELIKQNIIPKPLTVIDLFCGCGGMSKGLVDTGLNVLAGIDIWDTAIKGYSQNFGHLGICKDLTTYSPETFSGEYGIMEIDILVGSSPCQGVSIAGKRDKDDPRNSLFMEFVKYLNHYNPKAFLMENVIGMLSMKTEKNENIIDIIMSYLSPNYNCRICKLYASDFEVP